MKRRLTLVISMLLLAALGCSLGNNGSSSSDPTTVPLPTSTAFATLTAVAEKTPTPILTNTPAATSTPVPTATAIVLPPSCTPRTDWLIYVVEAGDTLASIARRVGSTTTVLVEANCLENPNLLTVGQQLRVPKAPVPTITPASPTWLTYPGDEIGVMFDYRLGWYVQRQVGNPTVALSSFDPRYRPPMASWTPDMFEAAFNYLPRVRDTYTSLDDWVAQAKAAQIQFGHEVVGETTFYLPGNQRAIQITLASGTGRTIYQVYTFFYDRPLLIDIYGSYGAASPVLSSMRPTTGPVPTAIRPTATINVNPTLTPIYSPSTTPTLIPSATPSTLTTFPGGTIGVMFDYPAHWHLRESSVGLGYTATVTTFHPDHRPHKLEWTENTMELTFAYVPAAEPGGLDAWVDYELAEFNRTGIQMDAPLEVTLPFGTRGVLLKGISGSGHFIKQLYTIFFERQMQIGWIGNNDLAFTVINTMRPVETPPTAADEPQFYKDTYTGFSFNYPADWTLLGPSSDAVSYAITLASYDFMDPSVPGREGIPSGESKIDIYAMARNDTRTVEQMRDDMLEPDDMGAEPELRWEGATTLADGTPALRLTTWEPMLQQELQYLLTIINGRGIAVAGYGQDTTGFDLVAGSLHSQ